LVPSGTLVFWAFFWVLGDHILGGAPGRPRSRVEGQFGPGGRNRVPKLLIALAWEIFGIRGQGVATPRVLKGPVCQGDEEKRPKIFRHLWLVPFRGNPTPGQRGVPGLEVNRGGGKFSGRTFWSWLPRWGKNIRGEFVSPQGFGPLGGGNPLGTGVKKAARAPLWGVLGRTPVFCRAFLTQGAAPFHLCEKKGPPWGGGGN